MDKIYFYCRIIWVLATLSLWGLLIFLANHQSENAEYFGIYSLKYFLMLIFTLLITLFATAINYQRLFKIFYNKRNALFLLCASVLFSIAAVEIIIRIIDLQGISYYSELIRYHKDKLADDELIYKHKSSYSSIYQDVECRFNEYGLRDDPILPKAKNEVRILVLGDSVTFGWGVYQEKIFPKKLQEILKVRLKVPVRVINTGVGSYNTVQEFTFLNNQGIFFDPDLIILVYVPNDVHVHKAVHDPKNDLSFKGKSPPQVLQLILNSSWLYRLIRHAYRHGGFVIPDQTNNKFDKTSPGVRYSMEAIKNIYVLANGREIPVYLFYFSWPTKRHDPLLKHLANSVYPEKVTFIGGWFEGKNIKKLTNSVVDAHPSSIAHKLMAEKMANYIYENYFLN